MSEGKVAVPVASDEGRAAVGWLRSALSSATEIMPISQWIKRTTQRLSGKAPDWLMATWAAASSWDYLAASRTCPEIAGLFDSDDGKAAVRKYLEAHNSTSTLSALETLMGRVLNLHRKGILPVEKAMVVRQVLALAMIGRAPGGGQFAESARAVLGDGGHTDDLLTQYGITLEQGDEVRLRALDAALSGTAYGKWVDCRLDEAKRYIGIDTPVFQIHLSERTPQWEAFWGNIIKGGAGD